ncbi:enoyl-ACP reductase [Candidatus Cyanaurora vandensis]|uniref:enoyl-ACP reductase FabI n=1 Tax=Candidatus Cyanaurora vandensis TaxID=2714958 RepID=UPI0025798B5C|nr:enoyl-ACP reductase [Candidatus Cyanaurora vandensis]
MGQLTGKTALILGVLNEYSLAWAITEALVKEGCECGFTYLPEERMERRVRKTVEPLAPKLIVPCDVQSDEQIAAVFEQAQAVYGSLDIVIHSIAFAPRQTFEEPFSQTQRADFHTALDISTYSLIAIARSALPIMNEYGSLLTLTYGASQTWIPHYNVMAVAKAALECSVRYLAAELGAAKKVRVNAISAGPIKTMAAAGIKGFGGMIERNAAKAPLRETVEAEDVGAAALYLCGPGARRVTGEILYVDSGYNIVGW